MSKKKWALLILVIILVAGYIKFFYKTWSEKAVPASADCVVALDVKRITNSLVWDLITTPGQWRIGKLFSKKSKEKNWRDMVKLPDYVLAFHSKGQPANTWYVLLDIKTKAGFEEGLKQFQFEKINDHEFASKARGLYFFVQGDKVLASNVPAENSDLIKQVANEVFTGKKFISRAELEKIIDAKSHLAVYLGANDLLQEAGILTANFNKKKIRISGSLIPRKQYAFIEDSFNYTANSICVTGFTQPPALLNNNVKEKISKALNVNIDSVMLPGNRSYKLDIQGTREKVDSAITYTYDDEFNKVEKLVVNNIQEPSFKFLITGENMSAVYNYLQRNNKLESSAAGDLFLPMPLVKAYCSKKDETELAITAYNYSEETADRNINAIFFFQLAVTKIPDNLWKYLPGNIADALSNIAEIELAANKNGEQVLLKGVFIKKENDLPIIKF